MKRVAQLSIVLLLILAVVAASGCTSSKGRKLVKEGYLTIGTEAEFAPFEVRLGDGSFYGLI